MKLQLLYGTDFNRKLLIHDQFFFLKSTGVSDHPIWKSFLLWKLFILWNSFLKVNVSTLRRDTLKSKAIKYILSIHRQWPITGYVCLWICTKLHLTRVKKCHLDTSIIIKHRFKSEVRVISKLFPIKLQLMSV